MLKSYSESMSDIQDEEVPAEVRRHWERRARAAGLPLGECLLRKMLRDAQSPGNVELFAEIDRTGTTQVSIDELVAVIREDRDSR